MIGRLALLFSVGLVLLAGVSAAQNTEKEEAAVAVAQKWLAIIDDEKYEESWNDAAVYFKNAVTKEQWQQSITDKK